MGRISDARKTLGRALGLHPKVSIYNKYIAIEKEIGEQDRIQKLFESLVKWRPQRVQSWIDYAEFEVERGEYERARGLPTSQHYYQQYSLYGHLIVTVPHVRVWVSWALFEVEK
ncbi:MAG: hypothetical protein EZS28_042900, partial [Streblomastix strix]